MMKKIIIIITLLFSILISKAQELESNFFLLNNKNKKVDFGPIVGISYSNYNFKSDELQYFKMLETEKFNSHVTPLYGLFLNYFFVPYEQIFSFNLNIYYTTYREMLKMRIIF